MIPEFGEFALILALFLALIQAIFPLIGLWQKKNNLIVLGQPAVMGQCFFVIIAYACLTYAFIANDFSVAYVANNSNSHLPWIYRIAAVWGAHEGSVLLWITMLACWSVAVTWWCKILPDAIKASVIAILGWLSAGFLLFLLLTSSPFKRFLPDFPVDGADLNPLLQDPGLAIHPPMLYMGYVGFAIVFAFAISALIFARVDTIWVRAVRPWAIAAWCFLTFGITLGSWWAYRVLGWGGWWFWDPVENAALLPWLAGTAFIHILVAVEKRGVLKSWALLLAIIAFSLSLLGTFLVRSGVLVSVHAFAADPSRGKFLLEYLAVVICFALVLYAVRAPKIIGRGSFSLLGRETFLLTNSVLLLIIMSTVLLGTLYPLILDALGGDKISVGPPYFNSVFVPLMVPLTVAMGVGPLCLWRKTPLPIFLRRAIFPFALAVMSSLFLILIFTWQIPFKVALGIVLASWIILTTLQALLLQIRKYGFNNLPRRRWGMVFAHIGIAVCIIGVTLTSYYKIEREVTMQVGDTVAVANYNFRLLAVNDLQGPNYTGADAQFSVIKNNNLITVLDAQKRLYTVEQIATSVAAIDAGLFRDLYVALGDPLANNAWSVRIYYKPFVRWIWLGGLLMLLGGVMAIGRSKV
jgi:cytochrome c-type biogenesis protein CcmF